MSEANRHIKLVVVGDGYVGKTCLLIAFMKGFYADYLPVVFDNFEVDMEVDGRRVSMTIWDTAGQDDYDRIRPLSYRETDGFLLCFSVDNNRSYENIATKWIREVRHFCPKTPLVLVGTKTDLRDSAIEDSNRDNFVTCTEGKKMAAKIKASKYVECSAKELSGLNEVFEEAVRVVLSLKQSHSFSRCTLL